MNGAVRSPGWVLIPLLVFGMVLAACGAPQSAAPAATNAPAPTDAPTTAPAPTAAPEPTAAPTAAPEPTAAAAPTTTISQAAPALEGTPWQLTGYPNSAGQASKPIEGSRVTAEFRDGKLAGSAGCNRYSGSYKLDGDKLTIGQAASTMMACADPAGVMEQESAYLAALESATTYTIDGDTLVPTRADGAQAVSFVAAKDTGQPQLTGVTWQWQDFKGGDDSRLI